MDSHHREVPVFPIWVSQEGEDISHSVGPGGRLQAFQMIQMLRSKEPSFAAPSRPHFPLVITFQGRTNETYLLTDSLTRLSDTIPFSPVPSVEQGEALLARDS